MPRSTRRPFDASYLSVDWGNPVSNHHLNRGLLRWYLVLPNGSFKGNGPVWRDLTGNSEGVFQGTLDRSNIVTKTHPGGLGAITFDNVAAEEIFVNATPGVFGGASRTFSIWSAIDAFDGNRVVYTTGSLSADTVWRLQARSTAATYRMNVFSSNIDFTVPVDVNGWHLITITYDGTTMRAYVDIEERGSSTPSLNTDSARLDIGFEHKGKLDDFRIWDRVLSLAEISEYYTRSRKGHPGLLNRWGHRSWSSRADVTVTIAEMMAARQNIESQPKLIKTAVVAY